MAMKTVNTHIYNVHVVFSKGVFRKDKFKATDNKVEINLDAAKELAEKKEFRRAKELFDVPLFLSMHNLCATLKCISPPAVILFRPAVINDGYRILELTATLNEILAKEHIPQANFTRAVASLSKASKSTSITEQN
ncbi:probable tRNA (guanine(26)-N(2))-dimethyltransferase 2 [Tanacetum coccineum]